MIAAIMAEAPQLKANSAGQVLSQAVTLGLLTVDSGTSARQGPERPC